MTYTPAISAQNVRFEAKLMFCWIKHLEDDQMPATDTFLEWQFLLPPPLKWFLPLVTTIHSVPLLSNQPTMGAVCICRYHYFWSDSYSRYLALSHGKVLKSKAISQVQLKIDFGMQSHFSLANMCRLLTKWNVLQLRRERKGGQSDAIKCFHI